MNVLRHMEKSEDVDENLKKLIRKKIGGPRSKNCGRRQAANKPKTRKELRKELRKNKKSIKHNYILNRLGKLPAAEEPAKKKKKKRKRNNKKKDEDEDDDLSLTPIIIPRNKKTDDDEDVGSSKGRQFSRPEPSSVDLEMEQLKKEMDEARKKRLLEENAHEDKFIRRMEKKLKLNKKAKVPASFKTDGLDCKL
jgi:hypothetical protein